MSNIREALKASITRVLVIVACSIPLYAIAMAWACLV